MRILLLCLMAAFPAGLVAQSSQPTSPTVWEQVAIYEINRARANPQAYDTEKGLGGVLTGITPAAALALNERLVTSSRFHSDEMATNGYFAHTSAVTGDQPNEMVRNAGYPLKASFPNAANFVESLGARASSASSVSYAPADVIEALILDAGVSPPGHRYHLLAWGGSQSQIDFNRAFREVGTGYAEGIGYSGWNSGAYWAIHTGVRDTASDNPWITGMVYDDANSNGRYDSGEELSGVTVTCENASQSFNFTTGVGGGYSFEVSAGNWVLGCSGGSFSGQRWVQVTVGSDNITADFLSNSTNVDINFGAWGALPGSGSVSGNGTAPSFTSSPVTTATQGQAYTYNLAATGVPFATFSASGLPGWLTLTGSTLSGTPGASDVGTTGTITLTASNTVAPDDPQSFTIVVSASGGGGGGGGGGSGSGSGESDSSSGGSCVVSAAAGVLPWMYGVLAITALRRRRKE